MCDCKGTNEDMLWMKQAVDIALETEQAGNLPIAALLVLEGTCVATAGAEIVRPVFHPGRHAVMLALAQVPVGLWPRAGQMTCYTTLEPCVMCMGALVLHGIGRVVFGAWDLVSGSTDTLTLLPANYARGKGVPEWIGPVMPEQCDPLCRRAGSIISKLPTRQQNGLLAQPEMPMTGYSDGSRPVRHS
jgi:tRNA(adenine34) deaminase